MATYAAQPADFQNSRLLVLDSATDIVQLPASAPAAGQFITIQNSAGTAATVTPLGGRQIDGSTASRVIPGKIVKPSGVMIVSNGTEYVSLTYTGDVTELRGVALPVGGTGYLYWAGTSWSFSPGTGTGGGGTGPPPATVYEGFGNYPSGGLGDITGNYPGGQPPTPAPGLSQTPVAQSLVATAAGTTWTLSSVPAAGFPVQIYRSGLMKTSPGDYTLSGVTVTFTAGYLAGDILNALYWKD